MRKEFVINNFDRHLLISENGMTMLIDTGSPFSISDTDLEFCGKHFGQFNNPINIDQVAKLLGTHIDALIGYDIISKFSVLFDYPGQRITFSDKPMTLDGADSMPIRLTMVIPNINLTVHGQEGPYFLDTGAKISYVDPLVTNGMTAVGEEKDFYIDIGNFTTPVFNVEVMLGQHQFNVRFGNLPGKRNAALIGRTGARGVMGYDLLKPSKILIHQKNGVMHYLPA